MLNYTAADVREVVRNVLGDVMGAKYQIDPAVRGRVTFHNSRGIPERELPSTLETMLRASCATMTLEGDTYKIAPIAGCRRPPSKVIEFVGVPLGGSEAAWKSAMPTSDCGAYLPPKRALGDRHCVILRPPTGGDVAFDGTRPLFINANFIDDKLMNVTIVIKPDDVELVLSSLSEKLGKPTNVHVLDFKTPSGLSLNKVATWAIGDGDVELRKYDRSIRRGRVLYQLSDYADAVKTRQNELAR